MTLLGLLAINPTRAAETPEKEFASQLRRSEAIGQRIFEQDTLGWRATDALLAAVDVKASPNLRGWITVRKHGRWFVRFIEDCATGYCAIYDVRLGKHVADAKAELVTLDPPAPIEGVELAMFRARQSAIAAMPFQCSEHYNTIVLPADSAVEWTVYLLSATAEHGVLPVGGHFCVRVSADGREVLETRKLANTCLTLKATPEGGESRSVAYYMTHVVSPLPIETHVFLSLTQPLPLYVMTDTGIWSVQSGRIRYVQPLPAGDEARGKDGG